MTRSRMPFQSTARLVASACVAVLFVMIAATVARASPNIQTISRQTPTSEQTDADQLTWRITFSEPVADAQHHSKNVDPSDFKVSGTTATLTLTPLALDEEKCSTVWDATLSGGDLADLNGTVTIEPNIIVKDDLPFDGHNPLEKPDIWGCIGYGEEMTNPGPLGQNDNTFILNNSDGVDNTKPTVAITGVPQRTSSPFTATFTFDEAVSGFEASDITVTGGTKGTFAVATSGRVWTLVVTPSADYSLSVAADAATDGSGNGNVAATVSGDYEDVVDNTKPTVAITGVPQRTSSPFTATFTFDEAVSGFEASDITVTGGTKGTFAEETSGRVWTLVVTPSADYSLSVAADAATDAADNGNVAATVSGDYAEEPPPVESPTTIPTTGTASTAGTSSTTGTASTAGTASTTGTASATETSSTPSEPPHPQTLAKLSGDAQEAPAGATLTAPFVVAVKDQNGEAFKGAQVAFSVTAGGGTLSAATDTTDANGRAATRLTLGSDAGTNAVSATVASLHSVTFTATAIAPHSLTKVSGDKQQRPVGTQLAKPFVVSVLAQNGAAFAGVVVAFSITAGGGTLSAATDTTDANGRAATRLTLGNDAGTSTVSATVARLDSVTFTATAIMPHSLTKVSGDAQQGQTGELLVKPFVVSVLAQNSAALDGVVVAFSVTAGGGTLSVATDTTDANGRAATRLTLGNDAGTNTVSATVARLDSVTFTATAITPHSLTKVSGDAQQGPVSTQLAKPFVVLVLDEEDEAIAGAVLSFTVTAGGGTMSSTTAITNTHGRAARTLTLGSEPGTNTVEVSVAGLDPITFTATAIGEELSFDLSDLFNQSGKLAALPDRTQLLQNAPNPFNSETVLSYFLLEPGPVRLEVFALSGQRVAVLQQGPQQAGYYRLHWDGRDAAGRSVASGIYLYRLMTSEDVLTRKLVLLR